MKINKEKSRGKANYGWLKANYSFSQYFNPRKMGFNSLRVINEDFIAPKTGFPKHGHKNMEILTIILQGQLSHTDSLGNVQILTPNKIQRMYAGSGITHSEFNNSDIELNLLQIWIEPNQEDLAPEYNEKEFDFKNNSEILLVSNDGRDGSIKIYQNVNVSVLNLKSNQKFDILSLKDSYVHVIKGSGLIGNQSIEYGDSAELNNEQVSLTAITDLSILRFNFL